jgi:tetrahydromethanopterin S-methyltransferase subunit D
MLLSSMYKIGIYFLNIKSRNIGGQIHSKHSKGKNVKKNFCNFIVASVLTTTFLSGCDSAQLNLNSDDGTVY